MSFSPISMSKDIRFLIIDKFLPSVLSVLPGSDNANANALVSWFCDNWPNSGYKVAKSRSRVNTDFRLIHLTLKIIINTYAK